MERILGELLNWWFSDYVVFPSGAVSKRQQNGCGCRRHTELRSAPLLFVLYIKLLREDSFVNTAALLKTCNVLK